MIYFQHLIGEEERNNTFNFHPKWRIIMKVTLGAREHPFMIYLSYVSENPSYEISIG
jgi:hypothetical protein